MGMTDTFEAMLARGQDTPLLRYSLGNAFVNEGDLERAIPHLAEAVRMDPGFSAAWKLYGKTLAAANRHADAVRVLDLGIAVAQGKGDIQAAKEMQVFRKRSVKVLQG
jgi:predicted Zn-dependent protease